MDVLRNAIKILESFLWLNLFYILHMEYRQSGVQPLVDCECELRKNNFNKILKAKGKIKEKDRSPQLWSCTIILFSDLMSFGGWKFHYHKEQHFRFQWPIRLELCDDENENESRWIITWESCIHVKMLCAWENNGLSLDKINLQYIHVFPLQQDKSRLLWRQKIICWMETHLHKKISNFRKRETFCAR